MQGITAVAFDLDGTLYPNYRLNIRLIPFFFKHWRLLAAFGKARSQIRREQEHPHNSFYDYQAQLTAQRLNAPPEQIKEKIEKCIYRGLEPYFSRIKLFPYVKELLAELRAASFKTGMLSDFPPQRKLHNLGLADCWDTVLCSEEIGALKPANRPFIRLAEELGCPPNQILYVGNSFRYDVLGARQAGYKTALITGRFSKYHAAKPDDIFVFHDYRQLRDYLL
ncbi:MAG: HAD family hydrolase [Treponema sp.]|nr:HAD family hydrolase [Treponema sp.]